MRVSNSTFQLGLCNQNITWEKQCQIYGWISKYLGAYKKKTSCKNNHVDMPSLESFHHWAYFLVHSLAWSLYFFLSVLYRRAISGTSGSSGFGSVSSEQMDRRTFEMVRAGDHWLLRMSRQMLPLLLMFGWYILVVKATLGGLKG